VPDAVATAYIDVQETDCVADVDVGFLGGFAFGPFLKRSDLRVPKDLQGATLHLLLLKSNEILTKVVGKLDLEISGMGFC
jgi:hypothetical protein